MLPSVSSSSENPNPSPLGLSDSPDFSQSEMDSIISSLLTFPDSPSLSIRSSFDRVLDNLLSSSDDSVQDQLIDRTLERFSLLLESTKRRFQKRATLHNSISWFLPSDLTIKIFSKLDTKSLMQVSACCTMLNKSAMDPLCYSHIDLTTAFQHADDRVLSTLINRSGKQLRSLKLGRRDAPGYVPSLFTNSCLAPLQFTGNLLRSLHIYSIGFMYIDSLLAPLSACANLTDLKIVGVNVFLEPIIELLAIKCCLIEHLFLDNFSQGIITYSTIELFVTNCPKLTSLTLLNFNLNEAMARIIFKGFRKLKYINLSKTFEIDGSFLRVLGDRCRESPLETLILRDCYSLQEGEVVKFLNSVIAGNFKSIRYIDVSSNNCLASNGSRRTSLPNFPLETLKKKRWDVTFVGDFPLRPRY
ncbi:F-box protein At4g02733 isoform X3 [Arabidopsis lyrata subsp. lyrata]|uniref:F-box protein At4g02733 isoform X3 n=1 Tax=Arabidopsis lyrata subsp. lyrata TaxID=81972 RepID=UPI000A29C95F|nr:F-box protein At4g02733 isoform X3 [Arabidopsis lyrata subsp. lyrata]|eukprot:XP_020876314.1 F-box protein At4g02733 isoform X3 [Arabidopsis lyrata subsp. lyrata]